MNWLKTTYKQKNKILLGALVAMLLLVYFISISRTVSLGIKNKNLQKKLEHADVAPQKISLLEKEYKKLQETFEYVDNKTDLRDELLEKVSLACDTHQVLLKKFEEPNTFTDGNLTVETHEAVMDGTYINLVKVIFDLENNLKIGKVVSTKFILQQDRKTKKNHLLAYVHIQSIKKEMLN